MRNLNVDQLTNLVGLKSCFKDGGVWSPSKVEDISYCESLMAKGWVEDVTQKYCGDNGDRAFIMTIKGNEETSFLHIT